jgi:hypothetical protein
MTALMLRDLKEAWYPSIIRVNTKPMYAMLTWGLSCGHASPQ